MFRSSVAQPPSRVVSQPQWSAHAQARSNIPKLHDYSSLMQHVKFEAVHTSSTVSGAPKCAPGTQVAILDDLCRWAASFEDDIRIQWIYGNERSGKSTLLRTLAKTLDKRRLLLASFFFGTAEDPTAADPFIPTITYQIVRSNRTICSHVEKGVKENPFILSRPLQDQADALLVHPLTQAYKEGEFVEQYPHIIIVDGFYESTLSWKQHELLQALNKMLNLPIRLAILVATRPRPHVMLDVFSPKFSESSIRLIALKDPVKDFKSLSTHVATKPLHGSGSASDAWDCGLGTRPDIADNLYHWATASESDIRIQWIYGNERSGKSTLLRTLVEKLELHGLLLATFSFSGTADYQNCIDPFVLTLANKIASAIPSVHPHVKCAIEADPFVLSRSLEAQAERLIVLPITQAQQENDTIRQYPCHGIIVVDGLDECKGVKKQEDVLRVLNKISKVIPLLFASQPEHHILAILDSEFTKSSTNRVALEPSSEAGENVQRSQVTRDPNSFS